MASGWQVGEDQQRGFGEGGRSGRDHGRENESRLRASGCRGLEERLDLPRREREGGKSVLEERASPPSQLLVDLASGKGLSEPAGSSPGSPSR